MPTEAKPEPKAQKVLRMPALAFPVREHAANALYQMRTRGATAQAALLRVGPAPLVSGALSVGLVVGLGFYLLREVPPQPLEALSVSRLEAPAVAAAPDWTKPGPVPIDSLPLDLTKLAIPEAPELGLALLPESEASGATLTLLASAEASEMPISRTGEAEAIVAAVAEELPAEESAAPTVAAESEASAVAASEKIADPAPGAALVRVFVPSDLSPDVAEIARAWVEADGDRVDAVREVPFRVSATHVRFYHDADRAEAERIAEVAGGEARDFTGAEQLPGLGYLELYVAGEGRPEDTATRIGTGNTMLAGVNSALTAADEEIVRIIEDLFD